MNVCRLNKRWPQHTELEGAESWLILKQSQYFSQCKIWRGRTLNAGQSWKNCVSHNQHCHQQKTKQISGQGDILSPREDRWPLCWAPAIPGHDTHLTLVTPRLAAALQQATFSLPHCTFVPAILSVWKTREKKPFHPQVSVHSESELSFWTSPELLRQTKDHLSSSTHFQPLPQDHTSPLDHYHIPKMTSSKAQPR